MMLIGTLSLTGFPFTSGFRPDAIEDLCGAQLGRYICLVLTLIAAVLTRSIPGG
jgi:hypothetical protein